MGVSGRMLLVAGHRRELERRMRPVPVVVRRNLEEVEVELHNRHEEERESRNLEREHHSLEVVERRILVVEERRSLVEVEVGRNLGAGRKAGTGCEVVEERHIDWVAGSHEAAVVGRIVREEVL